MGKTNGEHLDLKSKLNIVSGIIANAKKDLEKFFDNEFSEYLKESLKVSDNLIKIDNDILMRKN